MASIFNLRYSPLSYKSHTTRKPSPPLSSLFFKPSPPCLNLSLSLLQPPKASNPNIQLNLDDSGGNGTGDSGHNGDGGGGGGGSGDSSNEDDNNEKSNIGSSILGLFLNGWRSRVSADPQFPFEVLMEKLVGVTARLIADMAFRPDFRLTDLDFAVSTLVVGSIPVFMIVALPFLLVPYILCEVVVFFFVVVLLLVVLFVVVVLLVASQNREI